MDTAHRPNDATPGGSRLLASALTVSAGMMIGLIRLVPHPANFSAVGALGLFGGARLRSWVAFALPIAVMVATDLALWVLTGLDPNYPPWHISRSFVYGSFLVYVLIGRALARTNSAWWIAGGSLLGSLQFFLITNAGTWAAEPLAGTHIYSRDLAGLLDCLVAGLPFYQGDQLFDLHQFCIGDIRYGALGLVLGDLCFSALLFGAYAWLSGVFPVAGQPQPEGLGRLSPAYSTDGTMTPTSTS
jgi:hypothetical protein